ncbi:MAG: hypothetical protein EXR72_20835 [Myxococcales bacterium]|nr:hypothetical protein [Myxococcales bacterium]
MDNDSPASRPLSSVEMFLSGAIAKSLGLGLHTAEEFVARFPPDAIMEFLRNEPTKRARILTGALGVKEKTARALAPEHAGALLQTAFVTGEIAEKNILASLPTEDCVRHFPHVALWAFIINGDWWKKTHLDRAPAKQFMVSLLEDLRGCDLVTAVEFLNQLTITKLAQALPRDLLQKLFEVAAEKGRDNLALQAAHMFFVVTPRHLVECMDLEYLFNQLLQPFILKHNLVLKPPEGVVSELAAASQSGRVPTLTLPRGIMDGRGTRRGTLSYKQNETLTYKGQDTLTYKGQAAPLEEDPAPAPSLVVGAPEPEVLGVAAPVVEENWPIPPAAPLAPGKEN